MSLHQLPIYKGYTVDLRLRQFRKIEYGKWPQFIDFDSEKGDKLFEKWIDEKGEDFVAQIEYMWDEGQHVKFEYILLAGLVKEELKQGKTQKR